MKVAFKYRAYPTQNQVKEIQRHFQIHANIYNKTLDTLDNTNNSEWIGNYAMHKQLTQWKKSDENNFKQVNSKAAQQTVNRIYDAIDGLSALKQKGEKVGKLRHRNQLTSIEYNQSGFDVNENTVRFDKIGKIPIEKHRPTKGEIKGVTLKHAGTGNWYACVICEVEELPELSIEDIEDDSVVGIDVNVSNLFADTEGRKLESFYNYLEPELSRIKKEHKNLSRKEEGSNNYKKQHKKLSQAYQDLVNKRDDILHKLSNWYVKNYDLISVEDIDSKELSENGSGLGKYIRSQAWSRLVEFIEYKASQAGIQTLRVDPRNTTKNCSNPDCNEIYKKSLDDRVHSCEECGFETDRDVNASWNVLFKALDSFDSERLGQGLSELTPVEIDTSSGSSSIEEVPLSVIAESGSPRL